MSSRSFKGNSKRSASSPKRATLRSDDRSAPSRPTAWDAVDRVPAAELEELFRFWAGSDDDNSPSDKDELRAQVVEWMGSPPLISEPIFEEMEFRRQNTDLIHDHLAEFCKQFTKEEMYAEAQRRRIAVTPVYTAREFVESAQSKARNIFVPMEHPEVGPYQHFGPVPRFSETPGRIVRTTPLVGEHNEEVYCGDLGFTKRDLVALATAGVI